MDGWVHQDTIAALSTPAGESGIAVVRMTGPEALSILSAIFRPGLSGQRVKGNAWEHRRLYHGYLVDGKDWVDEVMCAVMRGPETYTGADTIEISCHGGMLIVSRVLELLYARGARAAEAGEFTKRAFLNGKIDLIQAEAVADLIHARSDLQQKVAREQLAGELSRRINELADEMMALLGVIEANIDFIEEGIDTLDTEEAAGVLERHEAALENLLAGASFARPFHEGYRVVIAGPVNAGKSHLFNQLVGDERAIVTEIPGTTRDVLREPVVVAGLLFVLQDTAGLRGTSDRVESIGIDRARTVAAAADIVLFVVDGSAPVAPEAEAEFQRSGDNTILVLNKADLGLRPGMRGMAERAHRVVETSAVTGAGIEQLRQTLVDCVGREQINWVARERVILNARLATILRDCREPLRALRAGLVEKVPLEILAVDARACLAQYEAATGKRYSDDLLDTIFSRFCIGK